jgi:ribose-phosphate pyrophosphokinase
VLTINGIPLKKSFIFPGGEVQIQLPMDRLNFWRDEDEFTIKTILNSSDKIMELMLVKDVLDYRINYEVWGVPKVKLICHYLPYARQDRICNPGESNASKLFNFLISDMYFDEIEIADVHNETSLDVLGSTGSKITHITSKDIFLKNCGIVKGIDLLIAPDKGAFKKVKDISDVFGIGLLSANKSRDSQTGKILGINFENSTEEFLINSIENKNVMIVDDICDGGGTFIELSKLILQYKPRSITLYVTHGIFSKGLACLYDAGVDRIITTDSFDNSNKPDLAFAKFSNNYYITQDKLKIIKL